MEFDELSKRVIGCAIKVHRKEAHLLPYIKLAGVKNEFLMNFNVTNLKSGIKRFVL